MSDKPDVPIEVIRLLSSPDTSVRIATLETLDNTAVIHLAKHAQDKELRMAAIRKAKEKGIVIYEKSLSVYDEDELLLLASFANKNVLIDMATQEWLPIKARLAAIERLKADQEALLAIQEKVAKIAGDKNGEILEECARSLLQVGVEDGQTSTQHSYIAAYSKDTRESLERIEQIGDENKLQSIGMESKDPIVRKAAFGKMTDERLIAKAISLYLGRFVMGMAGPVDEFRLSKGWREAIDRLVELDKKDAAVEAIRQLRNGNYYDCAEKYPERVRVAITYLLEKAWEPKDEKEVYLVVDQLSDPKILEKYLPRLGAKRLIELAGSSRLKATRIAEMTEDQKVLLGIALRWRKGERIYWQAEFLGYDKDGKSVERPRHAVSEPAKKAIAKMDAQRLYEIIIKLSNMGENWEEVWDTAEYATQRVLGMRHSLDPAKEDEAMLLFLVTIHSKDPLSRENAFERIKDLPGFAEAVLVHRCSFCSVNDWVVAKDKTPDKTLVAALEVLRSTDMDGFVRVLATREDIMAGIRADYQKVRFAKNAVIQRINDPMLLLRIIQAKPYRKTLVECEEQLRKLGFDPQLLREMARNPLARDGESVDAPKLGRPVPTACGGCPFAVKRVTRE
ncbi:MAG: hypothetical protein ABII22_06335 [Candidatus Micrarchaeota archaeon]